MTTRAILASFLCVSGLFGVSACEDAAWLVSEQEVAQAAVGEVGAAGLALVVDVPADTDVRGIRITVTRVSCGGEPIQPAGFVVDAPLEGPMPAGLVPGAVEAGLDPDNDYFFADEFWVLPAGCYDVEVLPIDEDGDASEDCPPARAEGVVIQDGQTTEVVLVSECEGSGGDNDPTGGLDVVGVLSVRHLPAVVDIEFTPSKFAPDCHGVTICVTVEDLDDQDIRFVWQPAGPDLLEGPVVVSHLRLAENLVRECVRVVPTIAGAYHMTVTAYDLDLDRDGRLVTDPDSFDTIRLPFYSLVDCEEPPPPPPVMSGRTLLYLFTFSDLFIDRPTAEVLVQLGIDWLDDAAPRVLVVLDDNHGGEAPGDAAYIQQILTGLGFDSELEGEPEDGLTADMVAGFDVVWFTNPGRPVDDLATLVVLTDFVAGGGSVVLSGDDMTHPVDGVPMSALTHLDHVGDGESACGFVTDDNLGPGYRMDIEAIDHPAIAGIQGSALRYSDDIDHSVQRNEGEQVLAWARVYCHPECPLVTPVIVAYGP